MGEDEVTQAEARKKAQHRKRELAVYKEPIRRMTGRKELHVSVSQIRFLSNGEGRSTSINGRSR